jgi:hypothetical protein
MVPVHDVVHLQGPLLRNLPSNSLLRSIRSGLGTGEHPYLHRAADRRAVAAPVPEAAGFCVSKQPTS